MMLRQLVSVQPKISGATAMSTTCGTIGLRQTFASTKLVCFFQGFWVAFQEWRERRRVRATLSGLSDWELMDIGTTRGEIEYIATNRAIDPRGIRSVDYLSTCR
jgi:uncharacterized protein YjiS (DUF1127 family)